MSGSGSHFPTLANATWGTIFCVHLHFRTAEGAEKPGTPAFAIFHCSDGLKGLRDSVGSGLGGNIQQFPVFVELVQGVDLQERGTVGQLSCMAANYRCVPWL